MTAGDPSASDVLNVTGSAVTANVITSDLGGGTVTEATLNPVIYTGIEILNIDAAGHNLAVLGTSGDDALDVTPTGDAAATVRLTGTSPGVNTTPVVNASNIGATFGTGPESRTSLAGWCCP